MTSQVQIYNVSQPFCPLEPHTVRDTDYAKPAIQGVLDYAYDNPITTAVSAIAGIAGSIVGGYRARNPYLGSQAIAALGGGLASAALTLDVSKAGTALWNAASQSAANGWTKDVLDDAYNDPKTAATCVSEGIIAGLVVGYIARNTNSAIQAIAAPAVGLTVAALRYGANKAGTALLDAASQSPINGWIKDVLDYAYDNPITTAVSAIAGIAGSVLGPLYSQAAIDALVFNEQMTAIFNTAMTHGGVGITHQIMNDVDAAYDNSRYDAILRQNLGRGFISGLGAAMVPHVLNYVGKTIYNSCTDQDGYCNQAMTAIF